MIRLRRSNGEPLSELAIFTDRATRSAAAFPVDQVRLVEMVVGRETCHFTFQLGAVDAHGAFHPDRSFPRTHWRIDRNGGDDSKELWARYDLGGRDRFSFDEITRWAHEAGTFHAFGINYWGIPDLVSEDA